MFELVEPLIAFVVAAVLIGLGVRSWRSKTAIVKWGGTALAGLATLLAAAIGVVMTIGQFKLHARSAPGVELKVAGSAEQIRHGQAIADSFCSGCHSVTGTLTGGMNIGEHFPLPMGSFVSSNLTPAGPLSGWSDGEIFRAIRNSVDRDDRWLVIMSITNAGKLSDADIRAVIAYLRSLPAAGRTTAREPDHFTPLGIVMLGAGMFPMGKAVSTRPIEAPPKAPDARYGEYIISYQDCHECHGADLHGGTPGQLPPVGPDLAVVRGWKFEEFAKTLRTGVDPNGHTLGPDMPWQPIGHMDDDDLRAVYEYLAHQPAT